MLKNNNERLEYIHNQENWKTTQVNTFTMKRLDGTNFVSLFFTYHDRYLGTRQICVGTYLLKNDGTIDSIYNYSETQIVNKLREDRV